MFHYSNSITNKSGDVLPGYYVQAVNPATGLVAPIYSDKSGTPIITASGVANMALVDANGMVSFYITDGNYNVNLYAQDATTLKGNYLDVPMVGAVSLVVGTVSMLAAGASPTASIDSSVSPAKLNLGLPTTTGAAGAAGATGAPGSPGANAGTGATAVSRAAMAAITSPTNLAPLFLTEAGREGLFAFSTANLSANVTADPQQGIYVPPTADTTGASGAWVRKFDGPVWASWFGVKGDGVNADGTLIAAGIALLKFLAVNNAANVYKGSGRFRLSAGNYLMGTTTLDITHTFIIEGAGTGQAGGDPTVLTWSAGATGFRIQRYNTSGVSTYDGASPHFGGDATKLVGLRLNGGYTNIASEGEYHAIHTKARCDLEDIVIDNWQGDGIYSNVSAGSAGSLEGNANGIQVRNVAISHCRNGVYLAGADTNAGAYLGIDFAANRRWGLADRSFLGNYHAGHQCASCGSGFSSGLTPTMVSNGTNRYAVIDGQESGAASNAPPAGATDNAWWYYVSAGAADTTISIPLWTNGIVVRSGGPYLVSGPNNRNVPIACYAEGGQGPSQLLSASALAVGGFLAQAYKGNAGGISSSSSGIALTGGNVAIPNDLNVTGKTSVGTVRAQTANLPTSGAGITMYFSGSGGVLESYDWGGSTYNPTSLNGSVCQFQIAGTLKGSVTSTAMNVVSGMVYQVAGTQVVGARQTGAAANATDLATAITLVNDLKTKLIAHGLIS